MKAFHLIENLTKPVVFPRDRDWTFQGQIGRLAKNGELALRMRQEVRGKFARNSPTMSAELVAHIPDAIARSLVFQEAMYAERPAVLADLKLIVHNMEAMRYRAEEDIARSR